MKARYLILAVLLVLAVMMAGCSEVNVDNSDDMIEDDDGDDDNTYTGVYTKYTIKELVETPYSYNGKDVEVKNAKVMSIKSDYSCTISDDSTTETITLYGYNEDLGLKPGDFLDIKGIFEQYKNQYWEITVRSGKNDEVKVTGSGGVNYAKLTIDELLKNGENYIGLLIEIKDATVTTKYKSGKFNVSDDSTTENLLVYIEYGVEAPHIDLNDKIDISGEFVKFYNDWEIKVRKSSDDNVSIVGETVDTYEEVTLAKLVGDHDAYENKFVKITNATVGENPKNYKFNVSDGSGNSIIIYTDYDAQGGIASVYEGDFVEVQGQVIYYEKDSYWEIKIRKDTDDKITKLGSGAPAVYTYLGTDVATLLDNATNTEYREKSVKLMSVFVVTKSSNYNYIFGVNDTVGPFNINLTVYGQEMDSLAVNDTVNVYGLFEWYGGKGYWEIKIRKNSSDKVEKV